jgi:hypothetical protein
MPTPGGGGLAAAMRRSHVVLRGPKTSQTCQAGGMMPSHNPRSCIALELVEGKHGFSPNRSHTNLWQYHISTQGPNSLVVSRGSHFRHVDHLLVSYAQPRQLAWHGLGSRLLSLAVSWCARLEELELAELITCNISPG